MGAKRVWNWYSPNKRELKVPKFTCLHFHFSLQLTSTNHINRCVCSSAQHLLVGHTILRLSLAARIKSRLPLQTRYFTLILGRTRGQKFAGELELRNCMQCRPSQMRTLTLFNLYSNRTSHQVSQHTCHSCLLPHYHYFSLKNITVGVSA
jgi:hypothetical protein